MSTLQQRFGIGTQNTFAQANFAAISDDDYRAAFEEGIAAQNDALAALAAATDAPCGCLLADFEASGVYLTRVGESFWTLKSADTNEARDAIDEEMSARLAVHSDSIYLNKALFDRFVALDERAKTGEAELDEQDAWLLSETLRKFRRSGIELDEAGQERLKAINEELAALESKYIQLVVKGRGEAAVRIETLAELDGLSEAQIAACKATAEARGWDGAWGLELVNTTQQPLLASLNHRATRERLFKASVGRSTLPSSDVRPIMLRLIALRGEKAHLLGFRHYADYVASNGCAKSTDNFMPLLKTMTAAAVRNAKREAEALQALLSDLEPGATLEAWDWQWLAEKLKASQLNLDAAELTPYLSFESVLVNGVFAAATGLYGITFHKRDDVVGYTADTRAYEIREADGSVLALALFDPYARASKEGGAWMTQIVDQSTAFGTLSVVTNNCNQPKPAPGKTGLMTWDEVTTLFHEFGHDLHGILSHVKYPDASGTSTPGDFVEFPSQVNEIWAWEPALIEQYARHFETGEPLPQSYVETLAASQHFGEGYDAAEIYQSTYLDQVWHQSAAADLPQTPDEIEAWEHKTLVDAGFFFELVPPRYKSVYFSHIWGVGYSANYYGYMWADVMAADAQAWFRENGGLKRENGDHFRAEVLSRGGSRDAMESYRAFRGSDPDPIHLIRRRGLE
ncbi:MAG: M3 family metallopeptidase [Propionibacteriaceae bacterium]|nr:M3 family metallopeptidase [Propionibacteriaceae bacterium]